MTIQWLAGFFDGEGSIFIARSTYATVLAITQKGRTILEEIKNFLKYGTIVYMQPTKYENLSQLRITKTNDVIKFLENILPYFKIKSLQGKLALQYLKGREHGRYLSEKEFRWRHMHYELMKLYNKRKI